MFVPEVNLFTAQKKFSLSLIYCVLLYILILQGSSFPANLVVVSVSVTPNDKLVTLPIEIQVKAGEKVSGVQFDLVMPIEINVEEIQPGESARKANKMCTYNKLNSYTYRVIVAGLNRETFEDGTIVLVKFGITGLYMSGKHRVKLSNVVLADPDGNSVPCVVQPGSISILNVNSSEDNTTHLSVSFPSTPEQDFRKSKNLYFWIFLAFTLALLVIYLIFRKRAGTYNSQNTGKQKTKQRKKYLKR